MTPPIAEERLAAWRQREAAVDRSSMRSHIAGLGRQLAEGARRAAEFAARLPHPEPSPSALVVAGMGGSAIGGDLVAASTAERRRAPLFVHRGYGLPAGLDERAVVVASSYSGDTEETLSAYAEAKARGLLVVALTTGGRLAALAHESGDPLLRLPPGFPPRAALGHSFAACAATVARLDTGLDPAVETEALTRAAGTLEPLLSAWLAWSAANPVLPIAAAMAEQLPVVHGGHPVAVAAARRWKAQINENGKVPAWTAELPEHNHNEIVGMAGGHPVVERLCLVYLETPWDDPRIRSRTEFLTRWSEGRVGAQHRVHLDGESPLDVMLRLCAFGDCASFLVSIITGQDPTPVTPIDELKAALEGPPSE